MQISRLDHLVLTVSNIEESVRFYSEILGMDRIEFQKGRVAMAFGSQKINLHKAGQEVTPHAFKPTPGSTDICLLTDSPIGNVVTELEGKSIVIELGPVERTGAMGTMQSVYIRDPDQNLVELSTYNIGA